MEDEKCNIYSFRFEKAEEIDDATFRKTVAGLKQEMAKVRILDCAGLDIIMVTKLYPEAAARYDPRTRTMFFEPGEEESFLHELGHFIWRKVGKENQAQVKVEWESKKNVLSNQGVSEDDSAMLNEFADYNSWKNENEYFADSFREYHNGTDMLKFPIVKKVLDERYKNG